ncbi:MAG: chloride channel protein, partial [Flavobacteriales bacterium]
NRVSPISKPVAVFAVEVIMIDLTAMSMVPLLMASLSAFLTTYLFLGDGQIIQLSLRTGFEIKHLHHYILLGVLCGFGSVYFTRIYLLVIKAVGNLKTSRKQILVAGIGLSLIFILFPALYGEGYDIINSFLKGSVYKVSQNSLFEDLTQNASLTILFLLAILLIKAVATGLTMGAGGIGGIFAPTLFMGSALGLIYSRVWNAFSSGLVPVSNVVLVAMAGLVAGVLHAPLTSIFLIAELSGGYSLFVPLMISSGVAFYISKGLNKHNIYTMELAQRGELITHDKDQAVLTLMSLSDEIETDFSPVFPHQSLRDLVDVIASSKRNLFPVINERNELVGVIGLDDVRAHMFSQEKYDDFTASDFMVAPSVLIKQTDKMDDVMNKFDQSNAWNLPVISKGKYMGFVSKSKLFSAYRRLLKESSL